MPPEQFWRLNPLEFWWLVDARRPQKLIGGFTEDELEVLYAEMEEAEQEEDDVP